MGDRGLYRLPSFAGGGAMSDLALECFMGYIDDPPDRAAVSLVCHKWCHIDSITRKHISIAQCYSISPFRLCRRFPRLESLKIKGKPRASMFYNLIPDDWGGYAGPWVKEIANELVCLKSVHLRRMIVKDEDISLLVSARGHMLQVLKLDKCSGFSTNGLMFIARSCRCLRTLFLEESSILDRDSGWLHELATNNFVLEILNFHMTWLKISSSDLELIARNCRSLIILKISDCDLSELAVSFQTATMVEEFCGGSFNDPANNYGAVKFPRRLCRLGLTYMGTNDMHIMFPFANMLKKLDLQYTLLNTEDHCQLIQRCPNLEVLEVRDVIGDRGLEVVAQTCRNLRRLRIERGEDEHGLEDEQGIVSHRGLSALAQGCLLLEYMAVYVSDITNAALESIGTHCKNLSDFRMVLLDRQEMITELPIDNGVRALLSGCQKLRRFACYLRLGGLSDIGLGYIGEFSGNIQWMLLGCVGESDAGFLQFSRGCRNLQKLELRGCRFSELAIAQGVLQLVSLKYIWVEGYDASPNGCDLVTMFLPFWNIEFIPPRQEIIEGNEGEEGAGFSLHPAQMLAYHSLSGRRTDYPETVIPLYPAPSVNTFLSFE
nr:coronatine insensitive 1 [Lilium hybrid cultivar]